MAKLLRVSLFLSISLLLFASQGLASHVMGGNITYTCVGQDSFLIRLGLYRDCSGIDLGLSQTIRIEPKNPSCGSTITVSLDHTGTAGTDITPLCDGWPSPCDVGGSSVPVGVEEYIYEGIVVIPSNNCDYTISWDLCCRNAAITSLSNPGSLGSYIHTDLNRNVRSCNNSPSFENVPVPYACAGLPVTFNHGVRDFPENDSMVFSLIPCLDGPTTPVTYAPGYSAVQPLATNGPIQIDSATGTLTFTPSMPQIGVVCVLVEEYDKATGRKLSEVVRDMQIVISDCGVGNIHPPEVVVSTFDTFVCPGQAFAMEIGTYDSTPYQVIDMKWNEGIPAGNFSISGYPHPTGTFTWTPTVNDIGFHFFTVTLKDDGCPLVSQATYAFSVHVREPNIKLGPDLTVCDGDTVRPSTFQSVDFTQYTWNTTTGIIGPTNVKDPPFSPPVTTTYIVNATNGFCSDTDTFTIFVESYPNIGLPVDPQVCDGESIELTATGGASYEWSTNEQGASITVTPLSTTTYSVTATSPNGCASDSSVEVTVNPLPNVDAGQDASICEGESYTLNATGDGNQFYWAPDSLVSSPTAAITDITADTTTTYTLTNIGANGCENTDQVTVAIHPLPTISAFPDTSIIFGQEVALSSGNQGAATYIWSPDSGLVPPSTINNAIIIVSPEKTTTYTVEVIDVNGCRGIDSVTIELLPGEIKVPNAFTPNGDQLNDKFYLIATGEVSINYFRVYNRWGELIFETNLAGEDNGWDGTQKDEPLPPGVYTYVVSGNDTETGEPYILNGNVTLIR